MNSTDTAASTSGLTSMVSGGMNPLNWNFLNEPAWKWAVFVVAMSLFLVAWHGVLRYMK